MSDIAGALPIRPTTWGSLGRAGEGRRGILPVVLCDVWRGEMREGGCCESEMSGECVKRACGESEGDV